MFPSFCGASGLVGWLAMLLLWGGLIAVVVWGIARLFPLRSTRPPDEPADREPPFAEPARR